MTRRFRRVIGGSLLVEAIEILKGKRISELPVVDDEGKPLGMLDITDVIAVTDIASPQQQQSPTDSQSPATRGALPRGAPPTDHDPSLGEPLWADSHRRRRA
jgi:arabinose-5-phosphate isomerase